MDTYAYRISCIENSDSLKIYRNSIISTIEQYRNGITKEDVNNVCKFSCHFCKIFFNHPNCVAEEYENLECPWYIFTYESCVMWLQKRIKVKFKELYDSKYRCRMSIIRAAAISNQFAFGVGKAILFNDLKNSTIDSESNLIIDRIKRDIITSLREDRIYELNCWLNAVNKLIR